VCERHTWLVSKSLFYRWIAFKLRLLAPKLLTPLEPRAAKSLTVARVEWLSAQEGLAAKFGNSICTLAGCARSPIPVLDQYAWLKRHNEPLSGLDFRHDGHWTVRGHQVAAEMILEHLRSDPAICAAAMPPQPNQ
jgi:hypothetical protein